MIENLPENIFTKRFKNPVIKNASTSHNLLIESGRHGRIRLTRYERICRNCDLNSIEDEFHFIIECPFFSGLRKKFIKRYYIVRPSMYKFICLMKSNDYDVLFNLCKYIKLAFKKDEYTYSLAFYTKSHIPPQH